MAETNDEHVIQWNMDKSNLAYLLDKMKNSELTKEEYKNLQYLLITREYWYRFDYPLCRTSLTGDIVMFIADTHFGNPKLENERLVNIAYNFAIQNNIKTVIHAGDLIEAGCMDHDKSYNTVLNELNRAINSIPTEVNTRLLLGNHDYSAIRTYQDIIPYYFNEKLDILGMQKVVLNWDNIADIRINHPISQLRENKNDISNELISLNGHSHFYSFKDDFRTIMLPSVSNETFLVLNSYLNSKGYDYYNYFMVAIKSNQNTLLFILYCIDKSLRNITTAECVEANVLTKELKFYNS